MDRPASGQSLSVLMVQRSAHRDGSAVSGLTIARAFVAGGGKVHTIFGHRGEIIRDYEAAGISCSVADHGHWLRAGGMRRSMQRVLGDYRAVSKISDVIRAHQADLVYVNSMVGLAGAIAGKSVRVPVIWHLRELFYDEGGEVHPPRVLGKPFVRRQIDKFSDRIICVSQKVVDTVLEGHYSHKTIVIPNTPDPAFEQAASDRIASRQKFGFSDDEFVIGGIGSNRPAKGFDVLLEAFAVLASQYRRVSIAIAGSGYHLEQLQSIPSQFHKRVHFVGEVSPVRHFFDACDLICIPSRSESFGRVAVEAFCASRPVVATGAGGLPEIVDHARTGLLASPGDAASLREALAVMITQPAFRARCVENAIVEFRERFAPVEMARKILSVATDVMSCSSVKKRTKN